MHNFVTESGAEEFDYGCGSSLVKQRSFYILKPVVSAKISEAFPNEAHNSRLTHYNQLNT